jgi:phosphate transport system protein
MNDFRRVLDIGLEELTTILFKMGGIAENTVDLSIEGFLGGIDVSDKVHSLSEILNTLSVDAEDKAFELIAKYQPVASDLRIIKSYIKIAYDLERYGRYAWDISLTHKKLAGLERCTHAKALIEEMTGKVMKMVCTSIRALKTHDAELAKKLAKTENEVDELYIKYLDQLEENIPTTRCRISNLLVVRYLERIADHAAYIGESVIYIATGEKIALR